VLTGRLLDIHCFVDNPNAYAFRFYGAKHGIGAPKYNIYL